MSLYSIKAYNVIRGHLLTLRLYRTHTYICQKAFFKLNKRYWVTFMHFGVPCAWVTASRLQWYNYWSDVDCDRRHYAFPHNPYSTQCQTLFECSPRKRITACMYFVPFSPFLSDGLTTIGGGRLPMWWKWCWSVSWVVAKQTLPLSTCHPLSYI